MSERRVRRRLPPYVGGSDTSLAAAKAMAGRAPTQREMVYEFIVSQGMNGATAIEVGRHFGFDHNVYSSRTNELWNELRIFPVAKRRRDPETKKLGYVMIADVTFDEYRAGR